MGLALLIALGWHHVQAYAALCDYGICVFSVHSMAKQVQEDSQLEHDDHWIEYIFPINALSKSRLKQLKVAMNSS